jgi:hypothetical protein
VQSFGSIFHAAEKSVRRTARIATVEGSLALALRTRQNIIADEDFVADGDALGVSFAPPRVKPLLRLVGSCVHFTSSFCNRMTFYLGHKTELVAGLFCPGQR